MVAKIAIICNSLNPIGGSEKLVEALTKVVKEQLGCELDLYAIEKPHYVRKSCFNNINIKYFPLVGMLDRKYIPGKTMFLSALEFYVNLRSGYNLVINVAGMQSPLSVGDLVYIHYPLYYSWLSQDQIIMRTYAYGIKAFWETISNIFAQENKTPRIFVANSSYTLSAVKRFLNLEKLEKRVEFDVVYPPVDARNISKNICWKENRRNTVVTLSRISAEKKLTIIPQIAKTLKEIQFIIIGRLRDYGYFREVKKKIEECSAQNVKLLVNLDEKSKLQILRTSKVYLHTMPYEHFGISIVEGMASGLVPVVHDSGGPREIVPEKYRYRDIQEAVERIESSISSWTPELARENVGKALQFGVEKFQENIARPLQRLM